MIKPIGGLRAQKQKNIDGKEDRLFLRQICRKIRWYVRCIFDPVILSRAKDPVGKIPLEFTFVSVLRRYLRLFLGNQCLSQRSLHSPSRGAILILVACFLPVILVGIKYSEKLFHSKDQDLKELKEISVDGTATSMAKRCAREAALAVARNWNPGLTLAQQQDAIYKVADAVYNASPIHQSSIIGQAIPGFDSSSVPDKQVSYNTDNAKYIRGWYITVYKNGALWNVPYGMWRGIDLATAAEKRLSKFDELDVGELSNNANNGLVN